MARFPFTLSPAAMIEWRVTTEDLDRQHFFGMRVYKLDAAGQTEEDTLIGYIEKAARTLDGLEYHRSGEAPLWELMQFPSIKMVTPGTYGLRLIADDDTTVEADLHWTVRDLAE